MVVFTDQYVVFHGTVPEFIFETATGLKMAVVDRPDFVFREDFLRCSNSLQKVAKFLRDIRYYAHAVENQANMRCAGVTGREGC